MFEASCSRVQFHRYDRAFVEFFEDGLTLLDYDWKQVVDEYLFSGEEPVFDSIMAVRKSLLNGNIAFMLLHRLTRSQTAFP